jgi:hypothetical protein
MRLAPLALLSLMLLGGCVVRYGEGPQAGGEAVDGAEGGATPADPSAPTGPNLSERYAPLEGAFDSLMASDPGEDADRRDRLDAARDLSRDLRRGKKDPHELIEAYLRRVAEIESRAVPADAPVLVIGPAVNEEDVEETPLGTVGGEDEQVLGEDPGVDAGAVNPPPTKDPKVERGGERHTKPAEPAATPLTVEAAGAAARDALAKNDYAAALDALRPMKDDERFSEIAPLWQEAVDGWVHHERERAGLLFQTSRAWPQAERDAATQEVKGVLEGLLRDYPETTYKAAIVRNLQLVERETAAAPAPK